MDTKTDITTIPSRLTEPATWAGVAATLAAIAPTLPTPLNTYVAIGAACAGGVAMYLRDAGNKPAALAAIDAIQSVVTAAKEAEAAGEVPAPAAGAADVPSPKGVAP